MGNDSEDVERLIHATFHDSPPIPLSELKNLTNGEFYDDDFSKGRYSTDDSIYQIDP